MLLIFFFIKRDDLFLDTNGLIEHIQIFIHSLFDLYLIRTIYLWLKPLQLRFNKDLCLFELPCYNSTFLLTTRSFYLIKLVVYRSYLAPKYFWWPAFFRQRFCPRFIFLDLLEIGCIDLFFKSTEMKFLSIFFYLQDFFNGWVKPTDLCQAYEFVQFTIWLVKPGIDVLFNICHLVFYIFYQWGNLKIHSFTQIKASIFIGTQSYQYLYQLS